MLTGINLAWFQIYSYATSEMQSAIIRRPEGNKGILVAEDRHALAYQWHSGRADHASRHLSGPGLISGWSSKDGDITARMNREHNEGIKRRKRKAWLLLQPHWERDAELDERGE